jgi:hypothetical protein
MVKLAITPNSKSGFLGSNPSGGVKIVVRECCRVILEIILCRTGKNTITNVVSVSTAPYDGIRTEKKIIA